MTEIGIQSHTPVEDIVAAKPHGSTRLPGNSPRPSEEGDPLSPSRWGKVQRDDDARGQPVCEDMAPLSVVWGVNTREAFTEGSLLACVSTSGVCPVPRASSCTALQSVSVWSHRVAVLPE